MASILKDIRAAFGDVEAAPYRVVVQRMGYEERVYPARRWACISMCGPSRHDLVAPMFRRLFSYISGRNEPNIRIDMTTPVVTYVQPLGDEEEWRSRRRRSSLCNGVGGSYGGTDATCNPSNTTPINTSPNDPSLNYTMAFLVPASHQKAPPTTADKSIFIEDRRKMAVLVRRFSGYMNDEVVRKEMADLRSAIVANGDEEGIDFERFYVAGYDPPFKFLGRRNEIWIVKRVWEREEEEEEEEAGVSMEKGMVGGDFVMVGRDGEDELMAVNGMVVAGDSGGGATTATAGGGAAVVGGGVGAVVSGGAGLTAAQENGLTENVAQETKNGMAGNLMEEKDAVIVEDLTEGRDGLVGNALEKKNGVVDSVMEGKDGIMEKKGGLLDSAVEKKDGLVDNLTEKKGDVIVEANGVVGRENGAVEFLENME